MGPALCSALCLAHWCPHCADEKIEPQRQTSGLARVTQLSPQALPLPTFPSPSHYLSDAKKERGQEIESFKTWLSTLRMSALGKGHQQVTEGGLRFQKGCCKAETGRALLWGSGKLTGLGIATGGAGVTGQRSTSSRDSSSHCIASVEGGESLLLQLSGAPEGGFLQGGRGPSHLESAVSSWVVIPHCVYS